MDLDKLSKHKFYIEHFDGCQPFVEMGDFGFVDKRCNRKDLLYSVIISYYHNRQGEWITLIRDQKRLGQKLLNIYLNDKNVVIALYRNWLKKYKVMVRTFQKLFLADLRKLSEEELLAWADKMYDFFRFKITMPGFLDGFVFYSGPRLEKLLKTALNGKSISEYNKILVALASPVDLSFIYLERRDLDKIIKLPRAKQPVLIDKHLLRYAWIKSSYVGYKPYTRKMLEWEIDQCRKSGFEKIDFNAIKSKKRELFKKYKFSREIRAIIELTELCVKWQDLRKVYSMSFTVLQEKILSEIARRTGTELELLRYCASVELPDILRSKFDPAILKKRQSGSLFVYYDKRDVYIFSGKKARKFLAKIKPSEKISSNEVRGMVANTGRAIGKVKIIRSVLHLNGMKPGDILVSPMTRPEYLPAMKKAAAIITDDGGLTCHAAIVARELKIPCVIGTKIATRVFKDGDRVEVDANRGIIKKIKP